MSQSINLVAYESASDGRIYETKTELIETAFISTALLKELKKEFPLVERKIYEVLGADEHYSIECFNDADIERILVKLEEMFLSVLKSDSERLLGKTDFQDDKNLPSAQSTYIKSSDISESISRFRTLSNIIYIFSLKNSKYSGDNSVVLKLG
ncbi:MULTISPECIES: hypothetical protein [Enterobacteriaceae]|uniref:hypothetical protein n=1 Tax=Enterobacteriaceae TaxID=543 RepID=UPI0007CD10B4|nr:MULTISPECIES: hypothetical protein [Enterobacteriaceae]ELE6493773.1 hypothetical protein [Enterobacter kobei]ELE6496487.1 hypothetical protein [Enterobacter kobei]ELP0887893.1 hypothetical protein [Klebsiella oxytoca]MBS0808916.1 hypothetical protein [Enterobacter hormaechei]MBS0816649.1 hypothetical protein [Enterobacter hormaechei]